MIGSRRDAAQRRGQPNAEAGNGRSELIKRAGVKAPTLLGSKIAPYGNGALVRLRGEYRNAPCR
jgi:hypothetical protein